MWTQQAQLFIPPTCSTKRSLTFDSDLCALQKLVWLEGWEFPGETKVVHFIIS